MDPAENQQMIIFRQVMQCLDDGIESLVAAEKAEDPDQLAPARDVIEHRKFLPGCRAPNIRHFGGRATYNVRGAACRSQPNAPCSSCTLTASYSLRSRHISRMCRSPNFLTRPFVLRGRY